MILRRDSADWKWYLAVLAGFSLIVIISIIIGVVAPNTHIVNVESAYNCTTPRPKAPCAGGVQLSKNTTSWNVQYSGLTPLNEDIYIILNVANKWSVGVLHTQRLQVTTQAKLATEDTWTTLSNGTHARQITCEEGMYFCSGVLIYHSQFVKYNQWSFTLQLLGDESDLFWMADATLTLRAQNAASTQNEMWFRYALFLLTMAVLCYFTVALWRFKWTDYSLEQRAIFLLLAAVLGFDNPFYALELVVVGWFFPFLNIILQLIFICSLLLFWLVILHAVRDGIDLERPFKSFYLPKVLLVGGLGILFVILYSWQTLGELDDPIYNSVSDTPGFRFFVAAGALVFTIVFFWMISLTVGIVQNMRTKNASPKVAVYFALLTLFTIGALIGGVAFNAFASQDTAVQILLFFGALNAYVWALAFMHAPGHGATPGTGAESQREFAQMDGEHEHVDEEAASHKQVRLEPVTSTGSQKQVQFQGTQPASPAPLQHQASDFGEMDLSGP